MSEPPQQPPKSSVVIKRYTKVIPVTLKPNDLVERASLLSQVLEEITSLDSEEKVIKAELKERRARLEDRRDSLASQVRKRVDEQSVEVELQASHEDGKAREVRVDDGSVLTTRQLTTEERQQHLFPPVTDDPYERGEIARTWFDAEDGRPEPINPFKTSTEHTAWLRWRAGYHGLHDPNEPFTSPWEDGRMADESETNPHVEGTAAYARWAAGKSEQDDPGTLRELGREVQIRRMVDAMSASGRSNIQQALQRLDAVGPDDPDDPEWVSGFLLEPAPETDADE